jgi:hypothetical protein
MVLKSYKGGWKKVFSARKHHLSRKGALCVVSFIHKTGENINRIIPVINYINSINGQKIQQTDLAVRR